MPRLLHNIAALSTVQLAGYLVPLITLPYVTRVLGVESWGRVALVQVVLSYFVLAINWGYSLTATRKVAADREDLNKVSITFFAVWTGQWLLCIASTLVLIGLIHLVPFFKRDATFYFWGVGILVSSVLTPNWFLNGLELMKQLAVVQVLSRLAGVPLILICVRSPADAPLMLGIASATGLMGGGLTVGWLMRNIALEWKLPSTGAVLNELRSGGVMFVSTVWIGLYTTLVPMILGALAGNTAVGYYALADRIRQLAQSILSPVSQALFPRMSHLFNSDAVSARKLLWQSSKFIVCISGAASFSLWLLAEPIVLLIAGESFRPAIAVLEVLAPLPFLISLSNIFGIQVMLPTQKTCAFNIIIGTAATLSLVFITQWIEWRGAQGAALNALLTESFVTGAMALYLWKTGFFKKHKRVEQA